MSGAGTTGPYKYLSPAGVIVPDTSDLQTEVEQEYIEALRMPDLDTNPETPQGGLIAAEVNNRAAQTANNAAVANQINPNIAGGIFLQAICAMTGTPIPQALPTTVPGVSVAGQPLTTLPAGSIAETLDGNGSLTGDLFRTTEQVQFNNAGTATVDFESVATGPINCPQYKLAKVVSDVLGWETVSNSAAGTLGTNAPTDAELRALRNNTLGAQGQSLSEAITSAVNSVPGVVAPCVYRENIANTTQTINGIVMVAKSIYLCVQGGADVDVANAIRTAKSGGCAYNGSTTVNITDPASGQLCPVSFDRPAAIPLVCNITVVLPGTEYTADDVVTALLAYAAGSEDNQPGFIVGGAASPFDMASGPITEIPGILVRNLQIGLKAGGGLSPSQITCGLNQIFTLAASDITVFATTQTS